MKIDVTILEEALKNISLVKDKVIEIKKLQNEINDLGFCLKIELNNGK